LQTSGSVGCATTPTRKPSRMRKRPKRANRRRSCQTIWRTFGLPWPRRGPRIACLPPNYGRWRKLPPPRRERLTSIGSRLMNWRRRADRGQRKCLHDLGFLHCTPGLRAARGLQRAARRDTTHHSPVLILTCGHITHAAPALSRAARARSRAANNVIVPCRVLSCVIVRIGWVRAQATRAVVAAEGGHQAKRG
jgi:hypothetical protein